MPNQEGFFYSEKNFAPTFKEQIGIIAFSGETPSFIDSRPGQCYYKNKDNFKPKIMKKIITSVLILLLLILAGIIFVVLSPERAEESRNGPQKEGGDKQTPWKSMRIEIIDHLEENILDPGFGGKVFADYHKWGRKEGELFLWVYTVEYYLEGEELKQGSGYSGPVAITLTEDEDIEGHWMPRDGKEYSSSIKERFPRQYWDKVLNFQSENKSVLNDLEESVEDRAEKRMSPEDGADITLAVGETETIELEANQTTGYEWQYTIDDQDIVEVVSEKYTEKEQDEDVVGAGGKKVFEVKGLQEGEAVVDFKYLRPWESKQPKKLRKMRIKVTETGEAAFDLPQSLETEYISLRNSEIQIYESPQEAPDRLQITDGEIDCSGDPEMSEVLIDGEKYCRKRSSEGAAGKIFYEYSYSGTKNDRIITADIVLSYLQCGNYPESEKEECENAQKESGPDDIANELMRSVEF